MMRRAMQVIFGVLFAGLIVFAVTREARKPALPRLEQQDAILEKAVGKANRRRDGEWDILGYQLVDLSGLKVRLKAEFQASNRELYQEPSVLEKWESARKDGGG